MNRIGFSATIGIGIGMAMPVLASDDQARIALDQAFDRQHALPGYVEHQFGRVPEMPGGGASLLTDRLTARVKERAMEKAQEKIAQATARVPGATELAEGALARLADQADEIAVVTLSPEREILTTEHAGKNRRELLGGYGEVVRANGRVASRFDVTAQVTMLRLAATVDTVEVGLAEVKSVRASIKAIAGELAQGGVVGILSAAMTAFDQVNSTLGAASGPAAILRAADMLEKQAAWRCEVDDPNSQHAGTVVDVQQLADETIGDVPAHVYSQTIVFGRQAPHTVAARDDDEDGPPAGFKMQSRAWVRVSDGLPLRSKLMFPGGRSLRMEYAYPAAVEFVLPECITRP